MTDNDFSESAVLTLLVNGVLTFGIFVLWTLWWVALPT